MDKNTETFSLWQHRWISLFHKLITVCCRFLHQDGCWWTGFVIQCFFFHVYVLIEIPMCCHCYKRKPPAPVTQKNVSYAPLIPMTCHSRRTGFLSDWKFASDILSWLTASFHRDGDGEEWRGGVWTYGSWRDASSIKTRMMESRVIRWLFFLMGKRHLGANRWKNGILPMTCHYWS